LLEPPPEVKATAGLPVTFSRMVKALSKNYTKINSECASDKELSASFSQTNSQLNGFTREFPSFLFHLASNEVSMLKNYRGV